MRYLVSFMVVLALALMPAMASADDCDCDTNPHQCAYTIYAATDDSPDMPVDQDDPVDPGLNTDVEWRWDFHRTNQTTGKASTIRATIDGTNPPVIVDITSRRYNEGNHCIDGTGTISDDLQSHMERLLGDPGFFTKLNFRYLIE